MPPLLHARWAAALLVFFLGSGYAAPEFRPDLVRLATVPQAVLPPTEVQKALEAAPRKDRPFEYAVGINANLALTTGRWETLDATTASWRLRIASAGAKSLSLHFAPFELPPSASVWIYDRSGTVVHGPYTAAQATPHGLWTPIIPEAELVVEVRVATVEADQLKLGIAHAYHGYRDWKAADAPSASADDVKYFSMTSADASAKSGACNIDVACPEADPWDNEVRSVARIQIGGTSLCSGQLLNNVRQDKDRLFITAHHCGISAEGAAPASSVIFFFNYQAPACAPPRGSLAAADTLNGATFLAGDTQSDFTLLRINDSIPANANVYFAGWDATGEGSSSGVSIHHPSGDDKAISFFSEPAVQSAVNIGAACAIDAWQVRWSSGTTESGSSGGGLWSAAHQLLGVLSGGNASCGNQTGDDFFGRLDRAWTANADPQGQIKAHLDPENTCIASIPGLDASNINATPITDGPIVCQGPASNCVASGGGGGGLPISVLWVFAVACVLRTRCRDLAKTRS